MLPKQTRPTFLNPKFLSFQFLIRASVAVLGVSALLLSGCSMSPTEPASYTIQSMAGAVHGGQSPIQASTVTLYVTSATATTYGGAATAIGTATSDVNGNFLLTPSTTAANCPSGQYVYVTAAGGYPSGTPTLLNNSTLMMVALGPCSGVNAATLMVINEMTTVAAGYALSGFLSTTASGSIFKANVSAPAANNATTGTSTAAAGLEHAFLNAAALVGYQYGTPNPLTSNVSVAGTILNGIVPVAELNALADILQSCVNGATGNASCGSLYNFTPSINNIAPLNTLQSMAYLARNPYPSTAAMTSASGLFSLISGSPAFAPALTAQPPDWSLAIVYKGGSFVNPYDIALDANDTVYQGASGAASMVALSAYGVSTPTYTAAGAGSATRQLAPDALGNVWLTTDSTAIYKYSAATGGAGAAVGTFTAAFGVAVDKSNNVWVADEQTASANVDELLYASGTPPTYTANYSATAPGSFGPVEITIDASQNIWVAEYYTNASYAFVLPNLSAATASSAPTYTTSGTSVTGVSAQFASNALKPLGLVIDGSGNAWYGITSTETTATPPVVTSNTATATGLEEVIPTLTNSVITSITPQSLIANATLNTKATQIPGIDGAGSIFIPDNQGSGAAGVHVYSTVATTSSSNTSSQVISPPAGYLGCYLATATTTTCASGSSSAVYNPREIAIDSAGSVWAGISTTGGLTQLIGLGAPTWPLLSVGKPSLSPGLTTTTPLP